MNEHQDSYDIFMEAIKACVEEKELQDVADKKILVLGTNMIDKFERLVNSLAEIKEGFRYTYIGKKSQIELMSNNVKSRMDYIEWDGAYNSDMVKYICSIDDLQCAGIIFLGSMAFNLRDVNIMEIGVQLKNHFGPEFGMYVYDYGNDEIYEYQNLEKYILGLKIYNDMNRFLRM